MNAIEKNLSRGVYMCLWRRNGVLYRPKVYANKFLWNGKQWDVESSVEILMVGSLSDDDAELIYKLERP